MKRLALFAVLACAPCRAPAADLAARAPLGGSWPALISSALRQSPTLNDGVFDRLKMLDPEKSMNARRFGLLIGELPSQAAGQRLTEELFEALPLPQQRELVEAAAWRAVKLANARAAKALDGLEAEGLSPEELEERGERAEDALYETGPYLSDGNRTRLKFAVGQLARRKADAALRLAQGMAAQFDIRHDEARFTAPSNDATWIDRPAPISARLEKYDLARAREDRSALKELQRDFRPRLAATRGKPAAFDRQAFLALKAFEKAMGKDLALIRPHALGPWAKTKLHSYGDQLDSLERWLGSMARMTEQASDGIGGRAARRRDVLRKKIHGLIRRDAEKQSRRLDAGMRGLERLQNGGRRPEHFFGVADAYQQALNDARGNPDPHHLPAVQGTINRPALLETLRYWEEGTDAATQPLRRRAWILTSGAVLAGLWLLAGPFIQYPIIGMAWGSAALAVCLYWSLKDWEKIDRFEGFGKEVDALLDQQP